MKVDLDLIQEMIPQALANPDTGDAWLDSQLHQYAKLVGHPNPYYNLFWMISKEFQPNNVVELGAYRGNAAAAFASGCIMSQVVTIDIHREDKDAQARCISHTQHYHNMTYINSWTWDAVVQVSHTWSPIDVLFIDAWHAYELAMKEWKLYSRLLAEEALVICDDVFNAEGATENMEQFWADISASYEHFLDTGVHSGIPMGFMRYVQ